MNTNKKDWFRVKGYPHIGLPLKPNDRVRVSNYVSDPNNISRHSFLPFIHKTIQTRKFRKEYDKDGKLRHEGLRVESKKIRHIYYANHFDANVYSFYSAILSENYEKELSKLGLGRAISAYRRIPLIPNDAKSRNMCNIDFANEVFEFIRNNKEEKLIAIAFDIKSFFDNLDHKILKEKWCDVLQVSKLPNDHYNVFRNITKFSYVEEFDLFRKFKNEIIVETKSGIRKSKKIDKIKYLKDQGAISYCEKNDFIQCKKRNKGFVKANKYTDNTKTELRIKGIPQGSPISSVLANIYLIDFDKEINKYISKNNGIYRRYSDDMVIVGNERLKDEIIDIFENEIKKCNLEIQQSKTQIFHFIKTDNKYNCFNETSSGLLIQTKKFEYLGFEFDGEFTMLKSGSLATYYRKLKRTLNRSVFYAKFTKDNTLKGEIFRKRLYKKFSYKGAERRRIYKMDKNNPGKWKLTHKFDWGNYLSYAYLAENNMSNNKIGRQVKNHWKILNELILKKEKILNDKKVLLPTKNIGHLADSTKNENDSIK